MDFRSTILLISRITTLSLREAIALADALASGLPPTLDTHEDRLTFARQSPTVLACLPDRKIQAIKELRTAADAQYHVTVSLKDAKDVIDVLAPSFQPVIPNRSF